MNILFIEAARSPLQSIAYTALETLHGSPVYPSLRYQTLNLKTVWAHLEDHPETEAVFVSSLEPVLRAEILETVKSLSNDRGWSLYSTPVYTWDLLGASGGQWALIGRMRSRDPSR